MSSLAKINTLNRESFIALLGGIFEHSPWVAAGAYSAGPFGDRDQLHRAMCGVVAAASHEEQLGLIRAHPDLVGRATLTRDSRAEQSDAGLMELSVGEIATFSEYNRRYKERFGFPFVICARLHKKEAILAAFPVRLCHSPQEEHRQALEEIYKIAGIRLQMLVGQ